MNSPEDDLIAALLRIDGYPVEGLSDAEKRDATEDTIAKADAAVVKTNNDLEDRAEMMTSALKTYFEAKIDQTN
tara:strand:+ start:187 stop:408 length:222 start_codon:yes stop_codon:yes gene_type:complete